MNLGFDREKCRQALVGAGGDVEKASEKLTAEFANSTIAESPN